MASANDQIYSPLKEGESRLVHLAPGKRDDPILCTLHHFDVSAPPPYEALSYAWGDPKITAPITVNGRCLQVTTNLQIALQHLRYEGESRVIWIDAIVINQLDMEERAQQVAIMAAIYSKAVEVRIWLGPADAYSTFFIEEIRKQKFGRIRSLRKIWQARSFILKGQTNIRQDRWAGWSIPDEQSRMISEPARSRSQIVYQTPRTMWAALRYVGLSSQFTTVVIAMGSLYLTRRAWFSRQWCLQELALARKAIVQCGDAIIEWNDLQRAIAESNGTHWVVFALLVFMNDYEKFKSATETFTTVRAFDRKFPLSKLLFLFRDWENGDPRDTVYSLLAIADLPSSSRIKVEYTRPAISVLVDIVEHTIRSEGHLNLIGIPWAPEIAGLPSWVVHSRKHSCCRNVSIFSGLESSGNLRALDMVSLPVEWAMNARIISLADHNSPLNNPGYTLLADGITLYTHAPLYDFPPLFQEIFGDVVQLYALGEFRQEKYGKDRKRDDRLVVLFGCNHLLLLRPIETHFILVEVWLDEFWRSALNYHSPRRESLAAFIRTKPKETFAIV